MDCAEIRRGFVDGRVPEGPAVEAHLQGCSACAELFRHGASLGRQLALGVLPAPDSATLFAGLELELGGEAGLRGRLRALPTAVRVSALVAVAVALLVSQLWLQRRPDFADYSGVVFWGVALVLLVVLGLGARSLLRGVSAVITVESECIRALLLLALPAVAVLVVPFGAPGAPEALGAGAATTWGSPGACFNYGAALVVPFVLLAWLFERRDAMPLTALLSAGALAGIAANLLLHAHCPSEHLGHLLLGHATIGVAWALGLAVLSSVRQRAR